MKRLTPLLLLLPALASAQDRGELAFNKACARCHPVQAPTQAQKNTLFGGQPLVGPAMSQVMRKRNLDEVRTWVKAPYRVNPKTACETRLLAPDDLDALMGYLATVTVPATPPRNQLLREQVEQQTAEKARRKKVEPKSQPTNQGKK
ncbi:c-type cytochrome [Corallococcus llansteffanensis]|nr:c-type cytochrome [Corallococcus llansteffanensis]